ncbi:MAG: PEP-CTERM sorting domain-containing protein [Burkholderiaceae bacterium]
MIFSTKIKLGKKIGFAAAASLIAISSAHAYTIDTRLGYADLPNSGDGTELQAMAALAGVSLEKITKVTSASALQADPEQLGQWFINVAPLEPSNFLLKFGDGNTGFASTYFFQNIGELDKLVFSSTQVNSLTGSFSHATLYSVIGGGGNGNNVPEPATVALLGLGLLGFAASRCKMKKA